MPDRPLEIRPACLICGARLVRPWRAWFRGHVAAFVVIPLAGLSVIAAVAKSSLRLPISWGIGAGAGALLWVTIGRPLLCSEPVCANRHPVDADPGRRAAEARAIRDLRSVNALLAVAGVFLLAVELAFDVPTPPSAKWIGPILLVAAWIVGRPRPDGPAPAYRPGPRRPACSTCRTSLSRPWRRSLFVRLGALFGATFFIMAALLLQSRSALNVVVIASARILTISCAASWLAVGLWWILGLPMWSAANPVCRLGHVQLVGVARAARRRAAIRRLRIAFVALLAAAAILGGAGAVGSAPHFLLYDLIAVLFCAAFLVGWPRRPPPAVVSVPTGPDSGQHFAEQLADG